MKKPVVVPALLSVDRMSFRARGGPVFTDLSLTLPAAGLGVVCGPSGSGRTSVLLAVTGRMQGVQGSGRLARLDLVSDTRAVRQRTALARISDLVDLEPQLTVAESLVERSLTEGVAAVAAERALTGAETRLGCLFPRTSLVAELTQLDRGRLALALACVRRSDLIVFDDVDHDLDPGDQRRLFAALTAVTEAGTAVLASTTSTETIPAHATVIPLPHQKS